MTIRKFLLSFAVLVLTAAVGWGQNDQLGVHSFGQGCLACHTPHSTGRTDNTATRLFGPGQAGSPLQNPPFTPTPVPGFTWKAASAGNFQSGSIYLWNRAITTVVYTTWDGQQITGTGKTSKDPEVHTLLCMTCHDNSMNSQFMAKGNWGLADGIPQPHVGYTGFTIAGGRVTWNGGNISGSHPVHVKYAIRDTNGNTSAPNEYWQVTVNTDRSVTFNDNDTNDLGDGANKGHPARLYSDGTSAYIECSSCHDPHRQTKFAYKRHNGQYVVGQDNSTVHFVRGPYSDSYALAGNNIDNGVENAGFCRSCHYEKSMEYIVNNGVSK